MVYQNSEMCLIKCEGIARAIKMVGDVEVHDWISLSRVLHGLVPLINMQNYIFKHFVKTVEATSLKFCTIIELIIYI